jgi:hypothetical protein
MNTVLVHEAEARGLKPAWGETEESLRARIASARRSSWAAVQMGLPPPRIAWWALLALALRAAWDSLLYGPKPRGRPRLPRRFVPRRTP